MQNIVYNFESLSEEDTSLYAGQWIAIVDGKVVAHGNSFREVYESARKDFPNEKPLIGKLPEAMPIVLSLE